MNRRVLSLSLDINIISNTYGNALARQKEYSQYFDLYLILVLSRCLEHEAALPKMLKSGKLKVYATASRNRLLMLWDGMRQAFNFAKTERIQVVTSQDPYLSGLVALLISWSLKIPYVLQLHSTYYLVEYHQPRTLMERLLKLIVLSHIYFAHTIRVVNADVAKYIRANFPNKKVVQIPLMIDIDHFLQPVVKRRIYSKFISVGRLSPEKNQTLLIKAFALVAKKNQKARLTIVGDGKLKTHLCELVSQLKLDDRVTFYGWAKPDELKKLLAAHHAFVLSSNYEGLAAVLIEAAAAGLPLISTRVGAAESLFLADRSALLTKTHSVTGLVRAMNKLIGSPALGYQLASKAQKQVLVNFDKIVLKQQWVEVLKQCK